MDNVGTVAASGSATLPAEEAVQSAYGQVDEEQDHRREKQKRMEKIMEAQA